MARGQSSNGTAATAIGPTSNRPGHRQAPPVLPSGLPHQASGRVRPQNGHAARGPGHGRQSLDLGAFLDDWLETQRQQLKLTTWASYRVAVERIKPGFGRRKLRALAPLDVETFYSDLAETGSRAGQAAERQERPQHPRRAPQGPGRRRAPGPRPPQRRRSRQATGRRDRRTSDLGLRPARPVLRPRRQRSLLRRLRPSRDHGHASRRGARPSLV